ncbi:BlaI/MecI/CopY family transcriptional regulator [Paucilactobacillus hokkaidonensis]|uniref:BlaI/MecI/CopY family transcriptional regulator n=1 Tax=Paucilactobacillus hokkaidonensis TaxID=1193095 RepID=UPI0006CFFB3C|nr:BlaI/MecI/CopY family transcriptional regulator [Paucilactobacillus hokkaidonensis]
MIQQKEKCWIGFVVKKIETQTRNIMQKRLTKLEIRHFNYRPTVPETTAMDKTVAELFQHLCDMKKGAGIINLLAKLNLSKGDIERMQAQLDKKLKDAPSTINCNCLSSGKKMIVI